MSELKIFLFGSPHLEQDGLPVTVEERKATALLAYLAVGGLHHSRDALSTLLWPNQSQSKARASLRHALWSLKKSGLGGYVDKGREEIRLYLPYWLDVNIFQKRIEEHRQHDHYPGDSCSECLNSLADATALYRDDFLAGFTLRDSPQFDEWQRFHTERLQQMLAYALESLVRWHCQGAEWEKAITYARRWVTLDALNEEAQRWLMRAYMGGDRRRLALKQFQTLRRMLAEELAAEPEEETYNLAADIRSGKLQIKQGGLAISAEYSQPMPVFRLRMPKFLAGGKPIPQKRDIFVAREAELNNLEKHLQSALSDSGGIVFVTGEAGSGKTALMKEFAQRAEAAHPRLISIKGICNAYFGSGDPYLPFRELLATLSGDVEERLAAGDLTPETGRRIWAALPQYLSTLLVKGPDLLNVFVPLPVLTSLISKYADKANPWLRKLQENSQRQKVIYNEITQPMLFEQITQVLKSLSAEHPLLLIIDDLQWVDSASISLLFHLGRRLQNSQILVLCAYRYSEVALGRRESGSGETQQHPLEPLVSEFEGHYGDIHIDLERDELVEGWEFVNQLLDSEPNQLGTTFRQTLFQRTKGHPLFTIEFLRDLQEQGYLVYREPNGWEMTREMDWQSLPARIEAVIAQRIGRLEPELEDLLAAASIEGEDFTAQVAARVLGIDERRALRLLGVLEQRHKLVREKGVMLVGQKYIGRYQFGHALFQWYIYQRFSLGERRLLHGEFARCLEDAFGKENDEIIPQLAHHYSQAGDLEKAALYQVKAGDLARRRAALSEAVQYYQAGLTHWPQSDRTGRAEILRKLGEILEVIGRMVDALDALEEAYQLYETLGERQNTGATQRLIGMVYYSRGIAQEGFRYLHQALTILQEGEASVELARAISEIARMNMLSSDYDQARDLGERAVKLGQDLGAQDVVVNSMTTLGATLMSIGNIDRGLPMLQESLLQALDLGLTTTACRVYSILGKSLIAVARYPEAYETFQEFLTYAEKIQSPAYAEVAAVQLGLIDWLAGRWGTTINRVWSLMKFIIHQEPRALEWKLWTNILTGQVLNDLGQHEVARQVMEKGLPLAKQDDELDFIATHLGELLRSYVSLGLEQEARAILDELLERYGRATYLHVYGLPTLLYTCYWLTDRRSSDYLEKLKVCIQLLKKGDQQYRTPETAAYALEACACLLLVKGDARQASYNIQQAADRWEEIYRPYDQMRTWIRLSGIMLRSGQRAEAEIVLKRASDIAAHLASQLTDPAMETSFWNSALLQELHNWQGELARNP